MSPQRLTASVEMAALRSSPGGIMYTLNANPHLMLQLAASTRADQIDRADRGRAHASARRVRSAGRRGGFWGGLRRRTERAVPASARTV
jgi:hypothetical protein